MLTRWSVYLVAACSLLGGCKPAGLAPVRGRVQFRDGTPACPGTVWLINRVTPGQPNESGGVLQLDGSFTITTAARGEGAPPGNYRVVVDLGHITRNMVYSSPKESPWELSLSAEGASGVEYTLDLDPPKKSELPEGPPSGTKRAVP